MKGILFTEFLDMVEEQFGADMVDDIIEESNLPSGGIYTSVGTYDGKEMGTLVQALSEQTNIPVPALLYVYGKHLFGRYVMLFPEFFANVTDLFTFLEEIEAVHHVEVRKLYPDAQLPRIVAERVNDTTLVVDYSSPRPLGDLMEGLTQGAIDYFGENVTVNRQELNGHPVHNGAHMVRLVLTRVDTT